MIIRNSVVANLDDFEIGRAAGSKCAEQPMLGGEWKGNPDANSSKNVSYSFKSMNWRVSAVAGCLTGKGRIIAFCFA